MAIAAEGLSGPQRQLRGRRVAHELEAFRNMVRTNAQLEMIKDAEAEVDKRRKAR